MAKAGRSTSRSPTTPTNTVASPTGSSGARSWRSPSPAYTYRTGWVPPSRSASHSTAVTSPRCPQQPHHCQVDASPSDNCVSRLNFESEHRPTSSSSLLNTDLTACDRQQDTKSQHTGLAVSNGRAVTGMVNGCSSESKVTGSSSSPDRCDGQPNALSGSGGKWAEKRDFSPCSTSVDTVPVLTRSPSSSGTVETPPVETLPNGSDDARVSSPELNSSPVAAASVTAGQTTSRNGQLTVRGVDPEPRDQSVPAELVVQQSTDFDGSTSTASAEQTTSQRPHSTDDDDGKPASRDNVVTSSRLDMSEVHRDSDLLLSARRTSVDYFQKVELLVVCLCFDKNTAMTPNL